MIESFVKSFPKETIINAFNMVNSEFIGLRDPIISQLSQVTSMKVREKIWDNVKDIFTKILQPMISIVANESANNLITKVDSPLNTDDSIWPLTAGIGIMNRKSASDIVTIKCQIIAPETEKSLVIPIAIFDTGSDSSLLSSNIVNRLNLQVDKTNAPEISGVASTSKTLGTVYGLAISIYDNDNSKTIEEDFMVIKSDKDFLLLGVPWIDRAKAILDVGNRQLIIPISARKKVIIPISVHKKKTNITSLQMESINLPSARTESLKKIFGI